MSVTLPYQLTHLVVFEWFGVGGLAGEADGVVAKFGNRTKGAERSPKDFGTRGTAETGCEQAQSSTKTERTTSNLDDGDSLDSDSFQRLQQTPRLPRLNMRRTFVALLAAIALTAQSQVQLSSAAPAMGVDRSGGHPELLLRRWVFGDLEARRRRKTLTCAFRLVFSDFDFRLSIRFH